MKMCSVLLLLCLALNSNAGSWTFQCSTGKGDFNVKSNGGGTNWKITMRDSKGRITTQMIKEDVRNGYFIDTEWVNRTTLTNINECEDDRYYTKETFVGKAVMTFRNGSSFPVNTLNVSKDGKKLILDMICTHETAGGTYCGNSADL